MFRYCEMKKFLLFLLLLLPFNFGCNGGGGSADYEGVIPGTLDISVVESGLEQPTRIKISPDGGFILVAQLNGGVVVFRRDSGGWKRQGALFFDLGGLGVPDNSGLTGLFFGADFDPGSPDPLQRDVFLSYQRDVFGVNRNRITRVTFTKQGEDFVGTDPAVIYQAPQPAAPFHQIQDGIGIIYEGAPHILVSIGDAFKPVDSLDITKEGRGKLLLMQRDGADPLGPRPYPASPKVQVIGLRNTYGIAMAPEDVDSRRRVIGVENGKQFQDRIWFLEAVDFGHEVDGRVSLGYTGSDTDAGWTTNPDVNAPGASKPEAVLALISPVVSPGSVSFHPGGGIIPASGSGQASFLAVYFGGNASVDNSPGKQIVLVVIDNLDAQPLVSLTPIVQRTEEALGGPGNPIALDVDIVTGEFYFADFVTGKLYRVRLT